ncbi:hypothetical protein NPIL_528581, partial [Nephila pilipes]
MAKYPLNKPPATPKLNPFEERKKKIAALKQKRQQEIQELQLQQNDFPPLPAQASHICSLSSAPASSSTYLPSPPKENISSIADTLDNLKNPQVKEVFQLIDQHCIARRQQRLFTKAVRGTTNANRLPPHISELQQFIIDNNPEIVALQETFLQSADFFSISNYKVHRTDQLTHRGGDTALLIKKLIEHHWLNFLTAALETTTINIETEVFQEDYKISQLVPVWNSQVTTILSAF